MKSSVVSGQASDGWNMQNIYQKKTTFLNAELIAE